MKISLERILLIVFFSLLWIYGGRPILHHLHHKILHDQTPEKQAVAITQATQVTQQIEQELELTQKGDILQAHWEGDLEGSYALYVVLDNHGKGVRHDEVHYKTLIGEMQTMSAHGLALRVIKVHKVGTLEWAELAQTFVKYPH